MNSLLAPTPQARRLALVLAAFAIILSVFFSLRLHVLEVRSESAADFKQMARTDRVLKHAEEILSGSGVRAIFRHSHDDVGFAFLVAGAWALTGERTLETIHGMTFLLDLLAMLALIIAVWRFFGTLPSLLTGFLYASYLPVAVEIGMADIQIFQVHFAAFLLLAVSFLPRKIGPQFAALALIGVVAILAAMVRGTFSLIAFPLGCVFFFRYGIKRGAILAGLLILFTVGGLAFVKGVLGNPTHIVAHHLFTGLADFPNPFGIVPLDTRGWEEARNVSANCEPYSHEYLDIVRSRALTLMAENPGFYVQTLVRRTLKVLFAGQRNWWFVGFGLERELAEVARWTLFLLFLVGTTVCWREKRREGLYFFLLYLYFGLILVPIVTFNENYFLAASVMQLPFAALALSRVRFHGCCAPTAREANETPHASQMDWELEPFRLRTLGLALAIALFAGVAGTGVFLAYARSYSQDWKDDFLKQVRGYELVGQWTGTDPITSPAGPDKPLAEFPAIEPGYAYLFHTIVDAERGRVALEVVSSSREQAVADPTYAIAPGRTHCFLGWSATEKDSIALRTYDPLPHEPVVTREERVAETIEATYSHYGIRDRAKWAFVPDLEAKVNDSLYPNGHADIPFLIDKLMWSRIETVMIPAYWAAPIPAEAALEFPQQEELSQMVLQYHPGQSAKPIVTYRGKGTLFDQPIQATGLEQKQGGSMVRYFFQPTQAQSLRIRFEEPGSDPENVYVSDISLPESARYRILETKLYRIDPPHERPADREGGPVHSYPEGYGYPRHLSFLAAPAPAEERKE